jgi:dihydrofolate reductase
MTSPTRIKTCIVAAVAENGVIGMAQDLPWRQKSDLMHFKALTLNKPIIMGSNTWHSLPKRPLIGRLNIVVSNNLRFEPEGALKVETLFEGLELAKEQALDDLQDELFIIGGAKLYASAIGLCDRLYITRIHASPEGDCFFPQIDETVFEMVSSQRHQAGDGDDHDMSLIVFERRK